jgi:ABC-type multidrug transport system ATPase subunit
MRNPLLEIKHIKKSYNKTFALKGVSLDIFPGEIVGLLGVNGAGKTTLSTIVATLHPPTDGTIFFNGASIFNDIPTYRSLIGYCPQKPNLNHLLTARDNLTFAGKYYGMTEEQIKTRLEELNQRLGINKYLDYYPEELSGGWKQRFMIARTLMHSPKLVIFDEPTVALDPDIRHQLWLYIKHLRTEGVSVLLTTHYLDEAEQLSDRVCVLDKGEVKLIDTPQNLMKAFEKGRLEEVFLHLTQEQKD